MESTTAVAVDDLKTLDPITPLFHEARATPYSTNSHSDFKPFPQTQWIHQPHKIALYEIKDTVYPKGNRSVNPKPYKIYGILHDS